MKNSWVLIFIFCASSCCFAGNFIHRDGKVLRDGNGNEIQLKGVNLGGWLLWEGWIWGGKFTPQSTLYNNISNVILQDEAAKFRDNIYHNFISEDDIRVIGANGFNVVRVPFNHRIFDTLGEGAVGWQIFDSLLHWCAKYHVYAVLDMHAAFGGESPYFIADPEKPLLWKSESDKEKTIALWKAIALRYKDNPTIAGYDLLNEPVPPNGNDLIEMYNRIVAAIREVDKNHLVILEGANFAKQFDFFKKLPDENMAFSFHIYTWFGGNPLKKMEKFSQLADRLNVPVWCGEWGENNYDVVTQTLTAFSQHNGNFCGWCFWTWKKNPNGFPALNGIPPNEIWKNFIKWCCKPDAKHKPSQDDALKILDDFEKNILYKNCLHDEQLMKLLSDDATKK